MPIHNVTFIHACTFTYPHVCTCMCILTVYTHTFLLFSFFVLTAITIYENKHRLKTFCFNFSKLLNLFNLFKSKL